MAVTKEKRKSALKGYSFLLRIRIEIPPSKKKHIFIHVSLILCILFPLIVGEKKKKLNLITRDSSIETSKLIETDKKKKTYKNWIFRREDKLLQLNRFTALIMRI